MEIDPTRMCELLVGLPDVDVLGVDDPVAGHLVVVVAPREDRPSCGRCGTPAWVKDHREVDLVDLPAFDQTVTLRVLRTRWRCPRFRCGVGSWTVEHPEIAPGVCEEPGCEHARLSAYLTRMRERGLATKDFHADAAAGLLMGSVFTHAMWREHFEDATLPPVEVVLREYVRLLLSAIGADDAVPATVEGA